MTVTEDIIIPPNEKTNSLVRDNQSIGSSVSKNRLKKKERTMTDDTRKVDPSAIPSLATDQVRRSSAFERDNSVDDFTDMFRREPKIFNSLDELNSSSILNVNMSSSILNEPEKPKSHFKLANNIVNEHDIHFNDPRYNHDRSSTSSVDMLRASMRNMPTPQDSITNYVPKEPLPPTRAMNYFPCVPILDKAEQFQKFDLDTLFLIFYYQQGTYQQYLAARELKKQNWRFHKKYLTWFQPHESQRVIDSEKEIGTYIYFDYETGWCQRLKSEFCFEYCFLEDELNFETL